MHLDYGGENICQKTTSGYDFYLVDLNRLKMELFQKKELKIYLK